MTNTPTEPSGQERLDEIQELLDSDELHRHRLAIREMAREFPHDSVYGSLLRELIGEPDLEMDSIWRCGR